MPAYAAPAIAILVFAVILIVTMVKSVPQGENWTVERFGRYTRTLQPGLRFLIPLMDRVGARINMMAHMLSTIDYHEDTRLPLTLPMRPASRGYERPPRDTQTYVPDHAASLLD